MRVEFVTKGFEKTEAMESFLKTTTLDFVDELLKHENDAHLRVVVDEDSKRNQTRKPHFACEMILKTGASKKVIKIKRKEIDFHSAVHEAAKALKSTLRKRSDRRHKEKYVDQRHMIEKYTLDWASLEDGDRAA